MDKATGEPLEIGGILVTSEREFASIAPFGTVEVEFSFDGSALAGYRTVAFESLALEGVEVAKHMDIEDEGQSVDLVQPSTSGTPAAKLAQTGDTNNITPLVCLAVVAALAAALAALHQRGGKREADGGDAEEAQSDEKEPSDE